MDTPFFGAGNFAGDGRNHNNGKILEAKKVGGRFDNEKWEMFSRVGICAPVDLGGGALGGLAQKDFLREWGIGGEILRCAQNDGQQQRLGQDQEPNKWPT
jgi:hypothetical protein